MDVPRWVLIALLPVLAGFSFVKYLTAHPLRMGRHLFLTSLALFSWLVLIAAAFRGIELPAAGLLSLLLFFAGYLFAARGVLARQDTRPVPELKRAKGDPGLGHTSSNSFGA